MCGLGGGKIRICQKFLGVSMLLVIVTPHPINNQPNFELIVSVGTFQLDHLHIFPHIRGCSKAKNLICCCLWISESSMQAFQSNARTFLFICVNGSCLGFVIWQTIHCINTYIEKPIGTRLKMEKSTSLPFPAITVCRYRSVYTHDKSYNKISIEPQWWVRDNQFD